MATNVGEVYLGVQVNQKAYNKQINGLQSQTKKSFGIMSVAVGNIVANMVTSAISSIGSFVSASIEAGSDLAELQNVVDSVFTTMSDSVDEWASSALDSYGLTETQAKKMVGTFGAMAKSFGYSESAAYDMSTTLAGLAGDVASFYNLSVDESYTKMKSVFTGETESLKELGIVMTQTALDEYALANGFGKTTSAMTEQEKVALRMAFVQDQLSTASGDVIRTSDSWANQTRKLSGLIQSLQANIGQMLIVALKPLLSMLNQIIEAAVSVTDKWNTMIQAISGSSSNSSGAAVTAASEALSDADDTASSTTSSLSDVSDTAAEVSKSLAGFDDINVLSSDDSDSSSSSDSSDVSTLASSTDSASTSTSALNTTLSTTLDILKQCVDLIKEGFISGLGSDASSKISSINDNLASVKSSMSDIFSDSELQSAIQTMVTTMASTAGSVAGSFANIGLSIGNFITGGIAQYFQNNSGFITDFLTSYATNITEASTITANLAGAVAEIFSAFNSSDAQGALSNVIEIFANSFMSITQLGQTAGVDILDAITKPIIDNAGLISSTLEGIFGPIETVTGSLSDLLSYAFGSLQSTYDSSIGPLITSIGEGLSSLFTTFLEAYNTYMLPVVEGLSTKFSELMNGSAKPFIDSFLDMIASLANALQLLWTNILVPIFDWLIANIMPILAPVVKAIGEIIMTVMGTVFDIFSSIFSIIKNVIDFVVNVFQGDWKAAWTNIKNIFSGVINIIKSLFSGLVSIFKSILSAIKGVFAPIGAWFKDKFNSAVSGIKSVFSGISSFFSGIWSKIKGIFSSVGSWFKSIFTKAVDSVKSAFSIATIKSHFKAILSGIKSVFGSVATWFGSIFGKAWDKVKAVFSSGSKVFGSIKDGIVSSFKSIVNSLIKGVNKVIKTPFEKINSVLSSIKNISILGSKPFSSLIKTISIPEIPLLAQGGWVKANQPTPVIVGDNKTQAEIISPEDKMFKVMMSVLESFFGKLTANGATSSEAMDAIRDIVIPIYLDSSVIAEKVVTALERKKMREG